jgi:hypothetical protein
MILLRSPQLTDKVYLVTNDFRVYGVYLDKQRAQDYVRDHYNRHGYGYEIKVEEVQVADGYKPAPTNSE